MLSAKRDMPSITKVGVQIFALTMIKIKGRKMASACEVLNIVIAVGTALKGACDD